MDFGLFLMPCHHPADNPSLAFGRDLEMIEFAEELGFTEAWVGEHHSGGWETIPAPDIFISAAAQRTKRIRLGAGVINLPYHHPFHVAERFAFLDHLTGGRVMLGAGPGALPTDIKLFGLSRDSLRPMMRESLEIILRLYTEDSPVTHEGDFWTISNMRLQLRPFQDPHMPIALASAGPGNSMELVAKHGLNLMSGSFFGGIEAVQMGEWWRQTEEMAAEHGNHLSRRDWRITTYVYLADSTEQALADIKGGVETQIKEYFFNLGAGAPFRDYDGQPDGEIDVSQMVRKGSTGFGWIVGDPDFCVRQLRRAEEETGGFGTLLIIPGDWAPREKWNYSLELFARHVMPKFKHWNRSVQAAHDQMVEDSASGALRA